MPSKKEIAKRLRWMPYEVDIECPAVDSNALLERLETLFRRKDTLLIQGEGMQCRSSLIQGFNLADAATTHGTRILPQAGFVIFRVRFGTGVRYALGEHLTPLELVAAAEQFANKHTGTTTHRLIR